MVYFEICRARLEITERKVERCKEMKIVIIDDEEENRKMMVEDVFGCRGFKNVTACRGIDEASEEMKKGPPDILITDIVGFSGRQNFECLITRCLGIGIKVIFFTGAYWEDIPKIEGVRILIKPVGNREIFDAIDEARKELEGAKANTAPEDQRLKLVYIEDFEPHKKKAVAKLRQHGFDIVAAYSNISEALGVIARKEVDVIVTDICGIGSEGRALEDFLYRCAKKNIAVIVYTGADWINVPNVRGVKRVMKPEFDKIYDAIDKARTELGDATTKRRMTKETREAIHRLANPEWHISTPTVKWLERIFENPDSTAVEKAIAMTSLETDVLRRELKEGTENGNWPRRKMDEYFDRYRELTGKLRALRRKAETNPHCGRIKTVLKC